MSGDLWTSLGNLVTNIVVICYCTGRPIREILETGLFEGDDGVFPFEHPEQAPEVEARSKEAGMNLTFDVAPWRSLSFCGNHFENINGELFRTRDNLKALVNLTVLFNYDRNSRKNDWMLQRSKALSMIDGPWIKGASVFACVIERVTRGFKVDPMKLYHMGVRLNEYSSYGLESCLPEELYLNDYHMPKTLDEWASYVAARDRSAGGICTRKDVLAMYHAALDENGKPKMDAVIPCPVERTTDPSGWYARDGLRFTHVKQICRIPVESVYNNNYGTSSPLVCKNARVYERHRKHQLIEPARVNHLPLAALIVCVSALVGLIIGLPILVSPHSLPPSTSSESLVSEPPSVAGIIMIGMLFVLIVISTLILVFSRRRKERDRNFDRGCGPPCSLFHRC
jgi:hypothetical protein